MSTNTQKLSVKEKIGYSLGDFLRKHTIENKTL